VPNEAVAVAVPIRAKLAPVETPRRVDRHFAMLPKQIEIALLGLLSFKWMARGKPPNILRASDSTPVKSVFVR